MPIGKFGYCKIHQADDADGDDREADHQGTHNIYDKVVGDKPVFLHVSGHFLLPPIS